MNVASSCRMNLASFLLSTLTRRRGGAATQGGECQLPRIGGNRPSIVDICVETKIDNIVLIFRLCIETLPEAQRTQKLTP